MSRVQHLALSAPVREFAERLLARHPEWEPCVAAYERVHPADTTAPGSLWLEVPSPHDPDAPLWAIVQDGEALVGLGHRAAEAIFTWDPAERAAAVASVLEFVDDVASGAVVGAWQRHRFLWRTWETCQFRRATAQGRRVVRVSAWPADPGGRDDAAT